MKRFIAAALPLLLSLAACGGTPEQPQPQPDPVETQQVEQFVFTRENFPRLNGSTAMVPLGQAIASVLLGETREETADLTKFSRTTQSYRELMNGQADLLISGAPPEGIYAEKEELGFEWELSTFAVDGLVFIVNADNPVDSLTTEQIQKIYTGEITNWSEVGGEDGEIVLIGREAGSGTRDGFESITGTEDACQYRQELTATGDVITAVAQNPNAIGYASLASVKDSVRAVSVGGVAPTEDTVKDGSYVIQRPFVLVTKSGTPLSDTAQKFFDFATSADAASLISDAGAVAANG